MLEILDGASGSEKAIVVLTVVSVVIAIVIVKLFQMSISKEISTAKKAIEDKNKTLLAKVIDNLSPRIVHCTSAAAVSREAASMIETMIDEVTRPSGVGEDKESSESEQKRESPFVTFYGAADLGHSPSGATGDEDESQFKRFEEALAKANEVGVRLRRYINLFTAPELEKRTPQAQREYLDWLCERFEFTIGNPQFEMINNPRVPQWGASFSSVITSEAILEVKANGLSAIAIYHGNISADIRKDLRLARSQAARERIDIFRSNDPDSIQHLAEIIVDSAKTAGLSLETIVKPGTRLQAYLQRTGVPA